MTAEEYYVSYYKLDPNEDLHNEALDYIMCMKEFAAQQCAEKDKQIEEWKEKWRHSCVTNQHDYEKHVEISNNQKKLFDELHLKLQEANKEIERLNERIKYWLRGAQ